MERPLSSPTERLGPNSAVAAPRGRARDLGHGGPVPLAFASTTSPIMAAHLKETFAAKQKLVRLHSPSACAHR